MIRRDTDRPDFASRVKFAIRRSKATVLLSFGIYGVLAVANIGQTVLSELSKALD